MTIWNVSQRSTIERLPQGSVRRHLADEVTQLLSDGNYSLPEIEPLLSLVAQCNVTEQAWIVTTIIVTTDLDNYQRLVSSPAVLDSLAAIELQAGNTTLRQCAYPSFSTLQLISLSSSAPPAPLTTSSREITTEERLVTAFISAAIAATVVATTTASIAVTLSSAIGSAAGVAVAGATGAAGGVMPLILGVQRMSASASLTADKSEMQTGVGGGLEWASGNPP